MTKETPSVAIASGDGIGPEIMDAVLLILKESGAKLSLAPIEVGEKLYRRNYTSGISQEAWDVMSQTSALLKGPITTPQGKGYKSLNVTMRKALGLYANVRPSTSFHPFVRTKHPKMDLVVIRENEEDIYAGIEYRHTSNMYESIKLISESGSRRIIEYAFDYAVRAGRKKISCFSKDNIMKFTDGVFHRVFDEIAARYPQIKSDHYIIDIGTARLADTPEIFDVIVTSNLYGDIISDVAAQISGSVGLAGSSNIGEKYAIFEAVHGSAPDIADKDIANPSGLLNAAVMMLVYFGQVDAANAIENALKFTIESGCHTADIYKDGISKVKAGTKDFAAQVVRNLGRQPESLPRANYVAQGSQAAIKSYAINYVSGKLVGVDVFLELLTSDVNEVVAKVQDSASKTNWQLHTVSFKGLKAWPQDLFSVVSSQQDHWCCRFFKDSPNHQDVAQLLHNLASSAANFIKVENLYVFGENKGFSLAQGE